MTCKHERILTLRTIDTRVPVMWMCGECREKFVPSTQMEEEVSKDREACAKLMESSGRYIEADVIRMMAGVR